MAFNVSALTDYINQTSTDLLVAMQFDIKTAKLTSLQTGIKSSAALQLLSTNPIPMNGQGCSLTPSGSVTFTQRVLTTGSIRYHDALCLKDLEAKWTQLLLKAGQNYSEEEIPAKIMEEITTMIKKNTEVADWQGDTNSGSAYLQRYDGLVKIIDTAAGVTTATASTINAANIRTILKNIITNIPTALKGNEAVKIWCGYDTAELYRQVLMDANLFHVPAGSKSQEGIYAEGSVHEIIPTHGLDGLNKIYAFDPKNAVLGVDMEGENEVSRAWFSQDDNNHKYLFEFRRGWQIAYPSEIVRYANA